MSAVTESKAMNVQEHLHAEEQQVLELPRLCEGMACNSGKSLQSGSGWAYPGYDRII